MRKLLLIVLSAMAAIALAVTAPAWASSIKPMVIGDGTLGAFGNPTVHLYAIETAAGTQGTAVLAYPDGTVVIGRDTCLYVHGATAYLTARITLARGVRAQAENWSVGNYLIIGVQDNHLQVPDLLNFSPGFASNPGCGPNVTATPVFPTVSGNFRVTG